MRGATKGRQQRVHLCINVEQLLWLRQGAAGPLLLLRTPWQVARQRCLPFNFLYLQPAHKMLADMK